jgi:hypothetical protein
MAVNMILQPVAFSHTMAGQHTPVQLCGKSESTPRSSIQQVTSASPVSDLIPVPLNLELTSAHRLLFQTTVSAYCAAEVAQSLFRCLPRATWYWLLINRAGCAPTGRRQEGSVYDDVTAFPQSLLSVPPPMVTVAGDR